MPTNQTEIVKETLIDNNNNNNNNNNNFIQLLKKYVHNLQKYLK